MATRAVLRANYARYRARENVIRALRPLGDGIITAWRAVLALERAAVRCGEERERGRAAKPKAGRKRR